MDKPRMISYYEHEAEIARAETHCKRWMIAALVMLIMMFVTNAGWVIYEMQYTDVVTETITSESDNGGISISNRDGGVTYGGESDIQ